MEFAIPLLALGGFYSIYNTEKEKSSTADRDREWGEKRAIQRRGERREGFEDTSNNKEGDGKRKENEKEQTPVYSSSSPVQQAPSATDYTIPEPVAASRSNQLGDVNKYQGNAYTTKYFDGSKDHAYIAPFQTSPASANATYPSLSGPKPASHFEHDNMVPFFKGRGAGRTNLSTADANTPLLDSYVGGGSTQIVKDSRAPSFAPTGNNSWTHGAPNNSDYFQERTYASSRMDGVKPFQEQSEGRGLTRDRTSEGQAAVYQSSLADRDLFMPKTVDELRQAGKAKSSEHRLLGHEGPAFSQTTERFEHAPVYKNRPETFAEIGPERYFTTKGVETAPAGRADQVERFTQRQHAHTEYVGAAGGTTEANGAYALDKQYEPTWRQELGELPVGIISAAGRVAGKGDYDRVNMQTTIYANNRSAAPQETYFGSGLSTALGAVVAPLLTALRTTRKETAVGNVRPYENAKSVNAPAYFRDPDRYLEETIRDTTHVENYISGIAAATSQNGGAYKNAEIQVRPNERDTTSDFSYAGVAQSATLKPREHEETDYRTNNNKSQTLQSQMVRGNTKMFNSDMGKINHQKEGARINDRAAAATAGPQSTPSASQIGMLQTRHGIAQKDAGLSRIDPTLSESFKNNPYFRR